MTNYNKTEYAVGAVRVSTLKQRMTGDSPEDQKSQIELHVKKVAPVYQSEIIIDKWFTFTESGNGEFDAQPVLKALEYCKTSNRKIKYFFIKSIDRFTRGGSAVYSLLIMQLAKYGIQVVDCYGVISSQKINTLQNLGIEYDWSLFSPSYMNELLTAERGKDEVRDILTRMIGAEVRYVRMGYAVRTPVYGLENIKVDTIEHGKRVILQAKGDEAVHVRRMFEGRIQGSLTDKEIVHQVNELGFCSRITKKHDKLDKGKIIGNRGGNKLTVKQFQQFIQKPIYAGVNIEKWTEGKPVKCQRFNGIVTIDEFNQANRGKVFIEMNGEVIIIHRNKPEKWRLTKRRENPDFAYKQFVLCPRCQNPLLGSSPRSKSGKHIAYYHCARNHKYWSENRTEFDKTIEAFCSEVKFTRSFRNKFREIMLEEWEKRRDNARDDSVMIGKQVIQLKQEQQAIADKIKFIESPVALKYMESDLERLELEVGKLQDQRNKKEKEEVDIQTLINYCLYFMEHLKELLLEGTNPLKDAAMFGLIFDTIPTYEDLVNRTPRLAPVFELNRDYESSKSLSVTPQRVELCLLG